MSHFFFIIFFTITIIPFAVAEDSLFHICQGNNYTSNSKFQSNLNTLLHSFTLSNSNFSTSVSGPASALFLCRGDVDPTKCKSCVHSAAANITLLCPYMEQAIVWYDYCQLRYSNEKFFGSKDGILAYMANENNQTDPVEFSVKAKELMEKVADRAVKYEMLFATGMMTYRNGLPAIYGLAQCTRDLSVKICSQCLQDSLDYYWNSSYATRKGGRILGFSCNFRYEVYAFFEGDPTFSLNLLPTSPSPSPSSVAMSPSPLMSLSPSPSSVVMPPPPLMSPSPSSVVMSPPPLMSMSPSPSSVPMSPPPLVPEGGEPNQTGNSQNNTGRVLAVKIPWSLGLMLIIILCIF